MKWVPRLPAEPAALAAYRAANPNDARASGTDAKATWNRFRDDAAFKQLRDELVRVQQGLCIYCEQRVTSSATGEIVLLDQQIEHVLPKSGGPTRTLDWTNLALCCTGGCYAFRNEPTRYHPGDKCSCGQSKSDDLLGHGCDPRDFPLFFRVVDVGMDGKLAANTAACQRAGISPQALERTINDTLNLNCERLRRAREQVLNNVRTWLVDVALNLLETSHLSDEKKSQFFLLVIEGRLRPDCHGHLRGFWTAERQYLEPHSDTWIMQNAHMFGHPATTVTP